MIHHKHHNKNEAFGNILGPCLIEGSIFLLIRFKPSFHSRNTQTVMQKTKKTLYYMGNWIGLRCANNIKLSVKIYECKPIKIEETNHA